MFLSLPSIEKGQSLTGFSASNFFGHKSFQWWNKFLPNANKQPQTQHPHLQPHGGNLSLQWGLWMMCFSPAASRGRNIYFPFPWVLQGHHCYLQADRAQHDMGMNFLGFSTGAGCLRHCSDLPSTASIA